MRNLQVNARASASQGVDVHLLQKRPVLYGIRPVFVFGDRDGSMEQQSEKKKGNGN